MFPKSIALKRRPTNEVIAFEKNPLFILLQCPINTVLTYEVVSAGEALSDFGPISCAKFSQKKKKKKISQESFFRLGGYLDGKLNYGI